MHKKKQNLNHSAITTQPIKIKISNKNIEIKKANEQSPRIPPELYYQMFKLYLQFIKLIVTSSRYFK
jgi:hypothetical protein